MSVIQAGVSSGGAQAATSCPLCAKAEKKTRAHSGGYRDDLLPWAIALTTAVVAASVGLGDERWFGIGVTAGLLAGGGCAWFTVRETLRERTRHHEEAMASFAVDADERVNSVIRQFEWAVNDIARLKRDADRAALTAELLTKRARERDGYVHQLERELADARERVALSLPPRRVERAEFDAESQSVSSMISFYWALHHDGYGVNLELQCGSPTQRPTRIRIVDREGEVVMTSGTAMLNDDGTPAFTMARPPVALLVDLDTGVIPAYEFEALVDLEWVPVSLQDTGRRTKSAWDKRGQSYRVPSASSRARMAQTETHATL
ncbi:MAG: hypothetical protein M3R54_08855 [Chloroflexota bacterium]|nr:hypothetical protein [Chloroflexota bacterium]